MKDHVSELQFVGALLRRMKVGSGSLMPAMFLVAFCWFAVGIAAAMALIQHIE